MAGDILHDPEAHRMVQEKHVVDAHSNTPEADRTDEFRKHVGRRLQEARRSTRLKNAGDAMRKTLAKAADRLERVEDQMKGLHERTGQSDFAPEAVLRTSNAPGDPGGSQGKTGRLP